MSFSFPVEAGALMAFAKAIGDDDERWCIANSPRALMHGGITAPPTFVASVAHFDPDWPYRPRPGVRWHGSGLGPGHAPTSVGSGTSMHAEQHYEYHQPLRPGDVLTVERAPGKTWEKQSARAGRLRFEEEITTFTNQHGEVVLTATRVRVITERVVEA